GERLLLLGPSGSGKSTLALCLDGVIPHGIDAHWESGSVTVAGRDTQTASLAELTQEVGVLFQDPETQLVMLETDDEIAFGLENIGVPRDEMLVRIAEARAATGLGPATPRRLEALSGGTKQRVALASLLAMRRPDELDRLGVWQPELAELARLLGAEEMPGDVDEAADLLIDRWPRGASAPREERVPGRITVAARGVAHRYRGDDRDAVTGASLDLHEAEISAIVGANGAGKSTLGLLLAGVLRPSGGMVDATGDVAYVFQYPERGFLAATVSGEMRYAATTGRQIARHPDVLLERFGLARLAEANPHSLSHGEKRRLSVASALVTSPAVLILDEPT